MKYKIVLSMVKHNFLKIEIKTYKYEIIIYQVFIQFISEGISEMV